MELLRLICFFVLLLALLVAERRWARRVARQSCARRWLANASLAVLSLVLLRLVALASGVALALGASIWAADNNLGLMQRWPVPLAAIVGFLLLDLAIYWQHRLLHKVPSLWRLHRPHHTDQDLDVTSALRFHPLEIALSMLWKMALIVLLGVPLLAVLAFEIYLNAMAMFNHANLNISPRVDRALRRVVVTPDVHRVHHSDNLTESNRNFGNGLIWWDLLFGTYQAQPRLGHVDMQLGVSDWQRTSAQAPINAAQLLLSPLFEKPQ